MDEQTTSEELYENPKMPIDIRTLCSRLTLARQVKGLSQKQLSDKSGIPQSQLSKFDNGEIKDPSFATVFKISAALDVDLSSLLIVDSDLFVKTLVENNLDKKERHTEASPADELSDESFNFENKDDKLAETKIKKQLLAKEFLPPEEVAWTKKEIAMASAPLICFGETIEEDKRILADENLLSSNILLLGRTGAGTSIMRKNLYKEFSDKKQMIIFNYDDHSYIETIYSLRENGFQSKDILVLDFSDSSKIGLNPLDVSNIDESENIINALYISQLESSPRAVMFLKQAVSILADVNLKLSSESKCTVLDILRFFTDADFRHMAVAISDLSSASRDIFDPDVGSFENLSARQKSELSMPILKAIEVLFENKQMRQLLDYSKDSFNFKELLSTKKHIIIKLSEKNYVDQSTFLLHVLLNKLVSSFDSSANSISVFVNGIKDIGKNNILFHEFLKQHEPNLNFIFSTNLLLDVDVDKIETKFFAQHFDYLIIFNSFSEDIRFFEELTGIKKNTLDGIPNNQFFVFNALASQKYFGKNFDSTRRESSENLEAEEIKSIFGASQKNPEPMNSDDYPKTRIEILDEDMRKYLQTTSGSIEISGSIDDFSWD